MRHNDHEDDRQGVESLTYRPADVPPAAAVGPWSDRPLLLDAPWPFRALAGIAWSLMSTAVAVCLAVVLVVLVCRLIGWLI